MLRRLSLPHRVCQDRLALTETHNSIVATWRAAANNGGESPTHYDVRIEGGGWIDAGLDLTHTFENLSAETEYTIEIAQVNSAGRGAIASESVTTDAVPVVIGTVRIGFPGMHGT